MKALGWWLMLVGSLRLASVWFGFVDIWALRLAVFSNTTMTEVHGRTFGVWTLLTCTLCFLCAFNLENKPLYLATFLSFIYAFGHFLTEYLIYHTMAIANLTTVGIVAVTEVHGRTFGLWTLLTCTLCFLCAFNLENKPLYLATFLSFIYAFGHFLTEFLIYHTMAIANLTTVGIFAVTEVHGRTFGVWTLLTCTLCFLCAFNLENKPLYLATFLSFIYAFGHFLTEYLIFHTMAIANLTTVGIFAGTSIIWMLLQWNAHQPIHPKHS